jgi:crossover junction endodeoxyribonuclease RusA
MNARTWTVELPAGLPLLNANKRQHHMVKADLTRDIRTAAYLLAIKADVPHLDRAHIVCEYRPPDRRRRDVHNLFPSAKAAVDGLVDAHILHDDSDAYLIGPDMRTGAVLLQDPRGRPVKYGQLVLHITELGVSA